MRFFQLALITGLVLTTGKFVNAATTGEDAAYAASLIKSVNSTVLNAEDQKKLQIASEKLEIIVKRSHSLKQECVSKILNLPYVYDAEYAIKTCKDITLETKDCAFKSMERRTHPHFAVYNCRGLSEE